MKKRNKEEALQELDSLISVIDGLTRCDPFSSEHMRWITNVMGFLEEVFGRNARYLLTFHSITWQCKGSHILQSYDPQREIDQVNFNAYIKDLDTARGLLLGAKDELTRSEIADVYKGKDTGPETSGIIKVLSIAENKLRKSIRTKPSNEKEVQDSFENLLIGADVAYSRETVHIEYSAKNYVPDFTCDRLDLAIEIKICNRDGREKAIIAEINDDILAYKTKYGNIIFVVYDISFIRDVEKFCSQFETQTGVLVRVVKH